MKKIILILAASFLIMSCGSNPADPNGGGSSSNGGSSGSGEDSIIGSVWAGDYISGQTIAFYFINDKQVRFGYCPGEDKAISYAKDNKGNAQTVNYQFADNKYTIENNMLVKNLTMENGKLIMNKGETGIPTAQLTKRSSKNDDEAKKYILDEINKYRAENRVSKVEYSGDETPYPTITKAANIRASEITELFDHKRPGGKEFYTVFSEMTGLHAKPSKENCGEIIAMQSSPEKAIEEWKKSAGHSGVMKDARWQYAAVGKKDNYYVVIFAKMY